MEVLIKIDTKKPVFKENPGELFRLLEAAAAMAAQFYKPGIVSGSYSLTDFNGNTVGTVSIKDIHGKEKEDTLP